MRAFSNVLGEAVKETWGIVLERANFSFGWILQPSEAIGRYPVSSSSLYIY